MYSTPLAYLLTWSTYGCRLHHDGRGSVDLNHNTYGNPRLKPDDFYSKLARGRMTHAPFRLTPEARTLVADAINDHAEFRRWNAKAVNPRTEHVHVVIHAFDAQPDTVVAQLKAQCTRRLREAGFADRDQPVWAARGGSTGYLFSEDDVAGACNYVINGQ